MFFSAALAIPASTLESGPVRKTFKITAGLITRVWVRWRYGSANLCGVRIKRGEFQYWPLSIGSWFPSSPQGLEFAERHWVLTGAYELTVEGYNKDDTFEHTVWVAFEMLSVEEAVAGGIVFPPPPPPWPFPPTPPPPPPTPPPPPPPPPPPVPPAPPAAPHIEVYELRNGRRGYFGERDTYVSKDSPTVNFSPEAELRVWGHLDRIGLMHFDLLTVPGDLDIQKVELVLFVTGLRSALATPVNVFRLWESWDMRQATYLSAARGRPWTRSWDYLPQLLTSWAFMGKVVARAAGYYLRYDVTTWWRAVAGGAVANFGFALCGLTSSGRRASIAGNNWTIVSQRPGLEIHHWVRGE